MKYLLALFLILGTTGFCATGGNDSYNRGYNDAMVKVWNGFLAADLHSCEIDRANIVKYAVDDDWLSFWQHLLISNEAQVVIDRKNILKWSKM